MMQLTENLSADPTLNRGAYYYQKIRIIHEVLK